MFIEGSISDLTWKLEGPALHAQGLNFPHSNFHKAMEE
jgi:hypothetical protein